MANERNLKPWKAGQSGNIAGKAKGTRNRSTIIREILDAAAVEALKGKVDLGVEPKTIFDQLVLTQVIKASLGDTAAFRELADGAFGKITDKVESRQTFTRMGNVIVYEDGKKPKALTFDVGEAVPEQEYSED